MVGADSVDKAVALVNACPALKLGGKITVYEPFNPQGVKTNSSAPD